MKVELNGKAISTVNDFHKQIADLLDFGPYYGNNLNALWDSLTTDVERPVKLVWRDSVISREQLGQEAFDMILDVLKAVQDYDIKAGWEERFELEIQ